MPFIRTQLPSNWTGAAHSGFGSPGGPSRAGVGGQLGDKDFPNRVPVLIGCIYRGDASAQRPPVFISPRFRIPAAFRLSGVTRDSSGAPLGNCKVSLFNTADVEIAETESDGAGAFTFTTNQNSGTYYLVAYRAGSPDVAGTTANTLTIDYTVA